MDKLERIFEKGKNLFNVGDNYICVSDEKIKEGDWFYSYKDKYFSIIEGSIPSKEWKKIIFSTQFIHESIPVLDIESEEDYLVLEELCKNKGDKNNTIDLNAYGIGVIEGYQKHKETFKYTEADLRRLYDMSCGKIGLGALRDQTENNQRFKNFLECLQQPKDIKSIEVEYEKGLSGERENTEFFERPTILSNGKVKCKINYE